MKITVLYGKKHLSTAHIAAFQRAAALNSDNRSIRITRVVMMLVGAAAVVICGALMALRGHSPVRVVAALLGVLLLVLGACYYSYLAAMARRRLPRKLTHMVFEFAEDGLHVANPLQSGTHSYRAFHAIGESRACYFLFLTPKDGYFIPKVSIPSSLQKGFGTKLEKLFHKKLDHYNF